MLGRPITFTRALLPHTWTYASHTRQINFLCIYDRPMISLPMKEHHQN